MIKYICDRCGKETDKEKYHSHGSVGNVKDFGFCESCQVEYIKAIEDAIEKVGENFFCENSDNFKKL